MVATAPGESRREGFMSRDDRDDLRDRLDDIEDTMTDDEMTIHSTTVTITPEMVDENGGTVE